MQQKKISLNVDYPKRLQNFMDTKPNLEKLFEVTKIDNKRQKTDTIQEPYCTTTSQETQPLRRLVSQELMDKNTLATPTKETQPLKTLRLNELMGKNSLQSCTPELAQPMAVPRNVQVQLKQRSYNLTIVKSGETSELGNSFSDSVDGSPGNSLESVEKALKEDKQFERKEPVIN